MKPGMLGGILIVVGIVAVVAGALLAFVVVPGMKQLPDDVDTVRTFQSVDAEGNPGNMAVLLNSAELEFMTDFPVLLERHVVTEETDGDVALVAEFQTLKHAETGDVFQSLTKRYALDRETMMWAEDYPDAWAALDGFWTRGGITLGWPIGSEAKDYEGWSDDYRNTVPLVYQGEQEHPRTGMNVYYFTAVSPTQPIHPDAVQAMNLPLELDKDVFAGLVAGAEISPTLKAALPTLLDMWEEDTVPLKYYYSYEGEYWVEPETGVLVDTRKHELRKVGLADEFMAISPLLANLSEEQRAESRITVYELTYQGTEDSVQEAADDAQEVIDQIELFGTMVPLGSGVLGVLMLLIGGFVVARGASAGNKAA